MTTGLGGHDVMDRHRAFDDAEAAALVARVQAGDRDAFAELYALCFDPVYSYLRVMVRDTHEAEDAAQQVFLKAFEALPRYRRGSTPFRAWLFTIARNHALTQLRRRGRSDALDPVELDWRRETRRGDPGHHEPPHHNHASWISDDDLSRLVEQLPLAQRQVLALRFMFDLPVAEVAQIMDLTGENVRVLQHRALRFLERRLAPVRRAGETRDRPRMRRWVKQAPVLRTRRFALR